MYREQRVGENFSPERLARCQAGLVSELEVKPAQNTGPACLCRDGATVSASDSERCADTICATCSHAPGGWLVLVPSAQKS